MLEIYIEPRRTINFKQAVIDSIESGEYETLQSDIRDCFTEDQVTSIEEVLESGDIEETIDEIITEWGGDDLEDLLETIESYFVDASIQIAFELSDDIIEEEEEDDFEEFDDDDIAPAAEEEIEEEIS